MPFTLKARQGLLYMKIGSHARESLEDIIARKTKEIEDAGFAFWGYGGNTCHPQVMVQPFARTCSERGEVIYLCMQPMDSKHFAEPIRATEFSVDGMSWQTIHPKVNVVGSRYALVIEKLRREEFELPLNRTVVAIGNSRGKSGSQYVSGRVDKACLEVIDGDNAEQPEAPVKIGWVAEICDPFAVYLRNQ